LKEDSELSCLTHVDTERMATEQGCHIEKASLPAASWAAGQILCSEVLKYREIYLTQWKEAARWAEPASGGHHRR